MEAPKARSRASRARSGEQNVSQCNIIYNIVPFIKIRLQATLPASQRCKTKLVNVGLRMLLTFLLTMRQWLILCLKFPPPTELVLTLMT